MILVNGVARAEVSATDRGLAYGDGVFRTMAARNGGPLHWARQYAKLARDCAALRLCVPQEKVLQAEVKTACGDAPGTCAVKVMVTRGAGRRGYAYAGDESPTRIVFAESSLEAFAQRDTGVKIRLCSVRLAHQPALAGIKHLNRLENVLARSEWSDPEIAEGLMCDVDGNVIAGTMTNVFIVAGGVLATPRLDQCGVAGVTRERVLEAVGHLGLHCSVDTLAWNEVLRADEVFVVNSLVGVWPVRELAGQARQPGPITRALQRYLAAEDDAQVA